MKLAGRAVARAWLALFATIAVCAGPAGPARAGAIRLEPWRGHVSFGYGHLFSDSLSPGGSISVAGGVDYPLNASLRVGPVIGISIRRAKMVPARIATSSPSPISRAARTS